MITLEKEKEKPARAVPKDTKQPRPGFKVRPHLRKITTKEGKVKLIRVAYGGNVFPYRVLQKPIISSNDLWLSLRRICINIDNEYKKEKDIDEQKLLAKQMLDFLHGCYNDVLIHKEYYDEQMLSFFEEPPQSKYEERAFKSASWYFEMRDFYDTYLDILPEYEYIDDDENE